MVSFFVVKLVLGKSRMGLQEFVAPIWETLEAVSGLFGVCSGIVLEPVNKEVFALLQHKELAKNHIGL